MFNETILHKSDLYLPNVLASSS